MGQFVGCLKGIGEACLALDFPVVSGNVSLYNETNGRGILPTPTIGGVGVLPDVSRFASLAFKQAGEVIVLVGETRGHLGQSIWLKEILGREEGAPPPVDLAQERKVGDALRPLILSGAVSTVHDLSDGGLAVALAEMAMASGIGATVTALPAGVPAHAALFGEDQARYVLAVAPEKLAAVSAAFAAAGVSLLDIGKTGGDALILPGEAPISVAELTETNDRWLPDYMAGKHN
jgi:phosphoribosylformylglycinamidine synthase